MSAYQWYDWLFTYLVSFFVAYFTNTLVLPQIICYVYFIVHFSLHSATYRIPIPDPDEIPAKYKMNRESGTPGKEIV